MGHLAIMAYLRGPIRAERSVVESPRPIRGATIAVDTGFRKTHMPRRIARAPSLTDMQDVVSAAGTAPPPFHRRATSLTTCSSKYGELCRPSLMTVRSSPLHHMTQLARHTLGEADGSAGTFRAILDRLRRVMRPRKGASKRVISKE